MDAILVVNESGSLITFVNAVDNYETRFKHTMILYNSVMLYNSSRDGTAETNFEMARIRVEDSMKKIMVSNVGIKRIFSELKIDYDAEQISIDEKGEEITISFSHSIIKVFF